MRVEVSDGRVIEGREAQRIIEWLKKERKKRTRVLKEPKKPKAKGQEFQLVCKNNHLFTVPAHDINDELGTNCPSCGERLKLQ